MHTIHHKLINRITLQLQTSIVSSNYYPGFFNKDIRVNNYKWHEINTIAKSILSSYCYPELCNIDLQVNHGKWPQHLQIFAYQISILIARSTCMTTSLQLLTSISVSRTYHGLFTTHIRVNDYKCSYYKCNSLHTI